MKLLKLGVVLLCGLSSFSYGAEYSFRRFVPDLMARRDCLLKDSGLIGEGVITWRYAKEHILVGEHCDDYLVQINCAGGVITPKEYYLSCNNDLMPNLS